MSVRPKVGLVTAQGSAIASSNHVILAPSPFHIALDALPMCANEGLTVGVSNPLDDTTELLSYDVDFVLDGMLELSICDFWWRGLPSLPNILVFKWTTCLDDEKSHSSVGD